MAQKRSMVTTRQPAGYSKPKTSAELRQKMNKAQRDMMRQETPKSPGKPKTSAGRKPRTQKMKMGRSY